MNFDQIKFGIEVETHLSMDNPTRVGGYRRPAPVPYLPAGWTVGSDSSIKAIRNGRQVEPCMAGRKDAEFASPKLVGEEGLKEAHAAVQTIKEQGARINQSCGVHVTITFPKDNAVALARLVCFFAHFEEGLYAATGSRARRNGRWSKSLKSYTQTERKNEKAKKAENLAKSHRYMALNLTHLAKGQDRVEFRLFSGSLDADKIIAWTRLVLAIAEFCLKSTETVSFESRETKSGRDYAGRGVGYRNLYRIFNKLGWVKIAKWGYKGNDHGTREIEGLPTVKEMVKILVRLAKKYDDAE
jgi:hypothetical protein